MTEPSKEAADAFLSEFYPAGGRPNWLFEPDGLIYRALAAAHSIERERWEQEARERLETAGLKDLLFQEAVKHLSFESPEHQEEFVWGLVDGVVAAILDSIFEKGEGGG